MKKLLLIMRSITKILPVLVILIVSCSIDIDNDKEECTCRLVDGLYIHNSITDEFLRHIKLEQREAFDLECRRTRNCI